MGTGANMSTAEKVAALASRRAELEALLAAKNEELYALCVQEVQLTGVVPPEAPLSPEAAAAETRERRGSVRSAAASDGDADPPFAPGRRRTPTTSTSSSAYDHKNLTHRLSTPSISGASVRSANSRSSRRVELSRSDFPQDTFSIPSSQTYPSLAPRRDPTPSVAPAPVYRHHTLNADYINKVYYSTVAPDLQNASRLRETHFSSSHPDIATHHMHAVSAQQPPLEPRGVPLLYQYASQLKAQSQHLSGLAHHHAPPKRREITRRNTLQRTQTYHLTAQSDYAGHAASSSHRRRDLQSEREYMQRAYMPMNMSPPTRRPPAEEPRSPSEVMRSPTEVFRPPTEVLRSPSQVLRSPSEVLRSPTEVLRSPSEGLRSPSEGLRSPSEAYSTSGHRSPHPDRAKEKQWYETSLDCTTSPSAAELPPRRSPCIEYSPSFANSQPYEIMSLGAGGATASAPLPLESPRNCTVVEQGKWIPYREVSKPFEMSDFYKYSTKFRQANQKTNGGTLPGQPSAGFVVSPIQDHWHGQNH